MKFYLKSETHAILGACFEGYREKGCGFIEDVFQECLEIEFGLREIPHISQPQFEMEYKGHKLRKGFRPDFICYDEVIVELKAVKKLEAVHEAQLFNYLRATRKKVGLLINFGHALLLEHKRIVF